MMFQSDGPLRQPGVLQQHVSVQPCIWPEIAASIAICTMQVELKVLAIPFNSPVGKQLQQFCQGSQTDLDTHASSNGNTMAVPFGSDHGSSVGSLCWQTQAHQLLQQQPDRNSVYGRQQNHHNGHAGEPQEVDHKQQYEGQSTYVPCQLHNGCDGATDDLDIGLLPMAFQLKSSSICLWGLDLPRLLPEAAAIPQPMALPAAFSLPANRQSEARTPTHQSVAQVLQDLQDLYEECQFAKHGMLFNQDGPSEPAEPNVIAGSGDVSLHGKLEGQGSTEQLPVDPVRKLRWAAKQCIRAAFELVMDQSAVYTRDLYWCALIAGQQKVAWQPLLQQALQTYVRAGAADLSSQEVLDSVEALQQLWKRLEAAYLQAMLTPDPSWVAAKPHHDQVC